VRPAAVPLAGATAIVALLALLAPQERRAEPGGKGRAGGRRVWGQSRQLTSPERIAMKKATRCQVALSSAKMALKLSWCMTTWELARM